jgi:hypothetical protein
MKIIDFSNPSFLYKVKHWTVEINQLYHPLSFFSPEEFNIVYSKNIFNKTKFLPILLKEWFYLINKNGYLVIDYFPNKICKPLQLEKLMWKLFKGKYEIIYHNFIKNDLFNDNKKETLIKFINNFQKSSDNFNEEIFKQIKEKKTTRFVCRKKESLLIKGDSVEKWTFGIITNGKKNDWVEKIVKSIVSQNIPQFEIIICGTYFKRKEKYIKYIPFSGRDKQGWITKKKNLIAQNAKYENLCFLHDRIVLEKNWYKGVKKWGKSFEYLCGPVLYNNNRVEDWLSWRGYYKVRMLDYRDLDKGSYIGGMYFLIKKYIYLSNLLDETRYWSQEEDVEFSTRLMSNGIVPRLNPFSKTIALSYTKGTIPHKPLNIKKDDFIYFPVGSYKRRISQILARILRFYGLDKVVYSVLKKK